MVTKSTESILKGLRNADPLDFPDLEGFCTFMVCSVQKIFENEFDDLLMVDAFELDNLHIVILEHLKENPFIHFLGTGTFSSVFAINESDKAFKINVASCDSFSDSWVSFAEKIISSDNKNPWLPNIHFLYRKDYIYGAIVDELTPISQYDINFQKKIVTGLKNIITTVENVDFKGFKSEQQYIESVLEHYEKSNSSNKILNAIEIILYIKQKTKSNFDIFPQNIMIDKYNNVVINDPLSYDKTYTLK
jgi:hypothetical protein